MPLMRFRCMGFYPQEFEFGDDWAATLVVVKLKFFSFLSFIVLNCFNHFHFLKKFFFLYRKIMKMKWTSKRISGILRMGQFYWSTMEMQHPCIIWTVSLSALSRELVWSREYSLSYACHDWFAARMSGMWCLFFSFFFFFF